MLLSTLVLWNTIKWMYLKEIDTKVVEKKKNQETAKERERERSWSRFEDHRISTRSNTDPSNINLS